MPLWDNDMEKSPCEQHGEAERLSDFRDIQIPVVSKYNLFESSLSLKFLHFGSIYLIVVLISFIH